MWNEALEDLIVVKRSGQRVPFNASKIAIAIKLSFDSVQDNDEKKVYRVFEKVLTYLNDNYKDRKTINVEDIQDVIEQILNQEKYYDVYNSFKEYRQKRAASRKVFAEKQQHKFVKAIERVQEETKQNSDEYLSPYKILNKFGRIISSEYTKAYVLDSKYVRASEEGNIFIHDLEYFNLGIIPDVNLKLDDVSYDNLLNIIVNAQKEVNGHIGINSFDKLLEKYILKKYQDKLKEYLKNYLNVYGYLDFINIKKCNEIINRINVLDFNEEIFDALIVNDNVDRIFKIAIKDAKEFINNYVKQTVKNIFKTIENYQQRNAIYNISVGSSTSIIGVLIQDEVINNLIDNNYEHINVIFKVMNNFSPEYKKKLINLLLENKNIYLSFIDNSYNKDDEDVEYFDNGNRIFEDINDKTRISTGRMVVGTSTINLARLGLKYHNKDIKYFYEELGTIADLVRNELMLNFELIGSKNRSNYQTLFNGTILNDEKLEGNQKIRKVIKNGVLNIGLVGLKECVLSLENDDEKRYKILLDILKYLNDKCLMFSESEKINFNLFEVNSLYPLKCLNAIDKAIYGVTKGINDKQNYETIDSMNYDLKKLGVIQKKLSGGMLININLPCNVTCKRLNDLLDELIKNDIGFVKVKVGK